MITDIRRILIAEDSANDLELTIAALDENRLANEIVAVRDGAEAIDYLEYPGAFAGRPGGNPALVLLDLKMPKVGGLEVIERLKSDPQLRSIPIIVLTSSDRQEDVDRAYSLGGNSYVVKPVTLKGLRAGLNGISNYWSEIALLPQPPA